MEEDIEKLIKEGNTLTLAGGFEVEDILWREYIKKIDGSIDTAMGLSKRSGKKVD